MKAIALTLALLFVSTAGNADESDPVPPATTADAPTPVPDGTKKAIKSKVVCERVEKLGSRLGGRKICKTVSQWEEERRDARDLTNNVQTNRGCGDKTC